jgi:hypothetical protein
MNNTETIVVTPTEEDITRGTGTHLLDKKAFSYQFQWGCVKCIPGKGRAKFDAEWHYHCTIGGTAKRTTSYDNEPCFDTAFDLYLRTLMVELHSPTATVKVCTQDRENGGWYPMGVSE